jgi:carboxymethylenebutenolidase
MATRSEWIEFGPARQFGGYLAWPERAEAPLPAIVVIQEAFGVNLHIEDVARRFAMAGYVALAPDLYAKNGRRPPALERERMIEFLSFVNESPPTVWMDEAAREAELEKREPEAAVRLRESHAAIQAGLALDAHLPCLLAATAHLRNEHPLTRGQRVGSVGFCMGGGLSALLAGSDPELAGAVVFYGMPPSEAVVQKIACPVLGFYGEADKRITDRVPAFAESMSKHNKSFGPHVYPAAPHAFFNDGRPSYRVAAARDAFVRTLAFFQRVLAS